MRKVFILIPAILLVLSIAGYLYIPHSGKRFTIKQEVYEHDVLDITNSLGLTDGNRIIRTLIYDSHAMDQCIHSHEALWNDNAEAEKKKAEQWIESFLELEELNKSLE